MKKNSLMFHQICETGDFFTIWSTTNDPQATGTITKNLFPLPIYATLEKDLFYNTTLGKENKYKTCWMEKILSRW